MSTAVATSSSDLSNTSDEWIELSEPKHLSRLLYTNPVCFLSIDTSNFRNVMVLSWITATNNHGRFVCSLNRRRHSVSMLSIGSVFVLSVPVKGMEQLVLDVGGTSGRWGSKFVHDERTSQVPSMEREQADRPEQDETRLSKRQLKKRRQVQGVTGLFAVSIGMKRDDDHNSGSAFAVDGTVAHLQCRVNALQEDNTIVDDGHYLVFGEVTQAFVRASYWDAEKNLFRPGGQSPPYLTFFGSQTFGYVVTR